MLTLAIQKSGRLSEKTVKLLHECGIAFENGGSSKLKSKASNFPMQILYLRDDDIPECVADGIADIGIVGENIYREKNRPLKIIERLGFARCRLSIAVPKSMEYRNAGDLNGLNIATSYPNILKTFLDEKKINANVHEISGSVEIAPGIGLADAIFDIVSTGSTLLSNGLREVETVIRSEAVLVVGEKLAAEKQELLNKLLFRIRAVQTAGNRKYILLNAPNDRIKDICKLLPGMKSPTIMPLSTEGWSSVHSVIEEDEFWEKIEALKAAGAQGILVIPIEKMIL
ncbi:ATP phosphoribosyltransferase [bacterium]|nr:ATP phosphoribosyltransferase [bacterium]MBU1064541.1 ATP phosphoribosyltransferase [bacterium]MBU1633421.1 ATP phosphoribosyltransferase [bacterium]MBU1873351.1 ATP phosphoribosyltransferase [bacterium]